MYQRLFFSVSMFSLDIENIDETYFGQEAFPCSVEVNKMGDPVKVTHL